MKKKIKGKMKKTNVLSTLLLLGSEFLFFLVSACDKPHEWELFYDSDEYLEQEFDVEDGVEFITTEVEDMVDLNENISIDATDVIEEENGPWVRITYPEEGQTVPNPVTFTFETSEEVVWVWFECEGWPLQNDPIPAERGSHTYRFTGVNRQRDVILQGMDSNRNVIATDEVSFTPVNSGCRVPDVPGFNHYTISAINDTTLYPKDGTYPYCWSYYGDTCGGNWGQIHDGYYAGEFLFPGGNDCFCSGHTLEIFLRAYQIWQNENGVSQSTPFTVGSHTLTVDDVNIGEFYQHWQGFGVASTASSANAFEYAGIGQNIYKENWDSVLPGDYVNLSRTTGTGHSVIFIEWIEEGGRKVGLRYYSCNTSGDSCPDPDDPENRTGISGPSFKTERFDGEGGTVIPEYLFIGRVFMPQIP